MLVKSFEVILRQYSKSPERKIFAENNRINYPVVVISSCFLFSEGLDFLKLYALTLSGMSTVFPFLRDNENSLYDLKIKGY